MYKSQPFGDLVNEIAPNVWQTSNDMVVKIIDKLCVNSCRELVLMRQLDHPNIIKMIGWSWDERIKILMPLALGDIYNFYNECRANIKLVMWQIFIAIDYCHKMGVCHRDIKPQNILVFKDLHIKLADFGLARVGVDGSQAFTDEMVTLWWRPPEMLLGENVYGQEIDIWSAGVILLDLYLGRMPFEDFTGDPLHVLMKIFKEIGTPTRKINTRMWDRLSAMRIVSTRKVYKNKIFNDLLSKTVTFKEGRITCSEILEHEYFSDFCQPTQKFSIKYTSSGKGIKGEWRESTFEWIAEIIDKYNFSGDTLTLALIIFDRYTLIQRVKKETIQTVAVVAIYISCCIHESFEINTDTLVRLSHTDKNKIMCMIKKVLKKIDLDIPLIKFTKTFDIKEFLKLYYHNPEWTLDKFKAGINI